MMAFAGTLSRVQAAQHRNSTEIDPLTILPVAIKSAAKPSMSTIRDTAHVFEVPAQQEAAYALFSRPHQIHRATTDAHPPVNATESYGRSIAPNGVRNLGIVGTEQVWKTDLSKL